MPHTGSDQLDLTDQRFAVSTRIEKLFLRRDMRGDWTPALRAEYAALCGQERALIQRLDQERFVTV